MKILYNEPDIGVLHLVDTNRTVRITSDGIIFIGAGERCYFAHYPDNFDKDTVKNVISSNMIDLENWHIEILEPSSVHIEACKLMSEMFDYLKSNPVRFKEKMDSSTNPVVLLGLINDYSQLYSVYDPDEVAYALDDEFDCSDFTDMFKESMYVKLL